MKDLSYRGTVGVRKRTINEDVFILKDQNKQKCWSSLWLERVGRTTELYVQ